MEREKRERAFKISKRREKRERETGDTRGDRTQMRQQERRHLVARSTLLD